MSAIATTSPPSQTPDPKDKPEVKQPPNPFSCFRSDFYAKLKPQAVMGDASKLAVEVWRQGTKEQRVYWEAVAAEKKREHELQYPEYKFQPASPEEKKRLREKKKRAREEKKRAQEGKRRGREE